MIADVNTNKEVQAIVKKLFIRCRKLNISLVFITQSFFPVQKGARLNSTHYLIMKIPSKRELQNIAADHSADIDYKDFMRIYRKCTAKPLLIQHYQLVILYVLERTFCIHYKMTLADKIKTLDDKIKANEA